ncbi:helix-turn-helix domain-containing protein [Microbacterium sp. LWH3-1.2]|uniref:helix-turn-helix domain-containing protein n=1 Tax=Microbacterium sp. LWH3-1.2 TaxID=3135256 RepID=UPI003430DC2D
MATDEQIGTNLTRIRNGMSQKDLAEAMRARGFKWSQATVWSVEKGERPLRLTEAEGLGVVLRINPDLLLATPQELDLHAEVVDFANLLDEIAELAGVAFDAQLRLARAIDDRPESEWPKDSLTIVTRSAIDAALDGLARAEANQRGISEAGGWLNRTHAASSVHTDAFLARVREVIEEAKRDRGDRAEEDDGIDQAEN